MAVAPLVLAERLKTIVGQATGFGRSPVGGVGAYVAHAPTGDLFVTRDKPNQVLRLVSRGGVGALIGVKYRGPSAPAGARTQQSSSLDVSSMAPDQTDSLYPDLTSAGTERVRATDPTVQFTAQATGEIACGGGCAVNASVSSQITGTGETTVVGAQVTMEMTAVVSVDGQPGGICVSPPTPIPANGIGQVSCVDPESGALANALLEQKKAAAAGRGGVISVSVTAQVEIQATAMTTAQVRQEVDRLK